MWFLIWFYFKVGDNFFKNKKLYKDGNYLILFIVFFVLIILKYLKKVIIYIIYWIILYLFDIFL